MSKALAEQLSVRLGARAPGRYLRFLHDREYDQLDFLELRSGFVEGRYRPDFTHPLLFGDLDALGPAVGIRSLDIRRWAIEFWHLLPLAVLEPTELEEEREDVGALPVLSLESHDCPVYLLVREYCMLVPVADTFDGFLAGRPWAAWSPGGGGTVEPYRAFGWTRSDRPSARRR
jgi:hypothetical protein